MITVQVIKNNNNDDIIAFELSGHANSGPYGYDLVCAAVSAVSFGAVNAIIELCHVDLIINQGKEGGYLHVALPDKIAEGNFVNIQLLIKGMVISLKTIEREYGEFIIIKEK